MWRPTLGQSQLLCPGLPSSTQELWPWYQGKEQHPFTFNNTRCDTKTKAIPTGAYLCICGLWEDDIWHWVSHTVLVLGSKTANSFPHPQSSVCRGWLAYGLCYPSWGTTYVRSVGLHQSQSNNVEEWTKSKMSQLWCLQRDLGRVDDAYNETLGELMLFKNPLLPWKPGFGKMRCKVSQAGYIAARLQWRYCYSGFQKGNSW